LFIQGETSYNNFIFVGEAGGGKSEIAVNAAKQLKESGDKPVHFFDMDMTKPLFRSRDIREQLEDWGIRCHYEEQFMDAPTLVGGVKRLMRDVDCYVLMDVGGDYMGARSIGGFAPLINSNETITYYVVNSYRPWSADMVHIDQVLGAVLGVSHIQLEKVHLISNPNIGNETTVDEIIDGHSKLVKMLSPYKPLDFICVRQDLLEEVKAGISVPVMPLQLFIKYPWAIDEGYETNLM